MALKAFGFVSILIFFRPKQNLTLIFSTIFIRDHFGQVLVTLWPHLDHVKAIFDHISNTIKVGRDEELFDDKINAIVMNLECVLPEKEKEIDK